jgi:hypothetical protein
MDAMVAVAAVVVVAEVVAVCILSLLRPKKKKTPR